MSNLSVFKGAPIVDAKTIQMIREMYSAKGYRDFTGDKAITEDELPEEEKVKFYKDSAEILEAIQYGIVMKSGSYWGKDLPVIPEISTSFYIGEKVVKEGVMPLQSRKIDFEVTDTLAGKILKYSESCEFKSSYSNDPNLYYHGQSIYLNMATGSIAKGSGDTYLPSDVKSYKAFIGLFREDAEKSIKEQKDGENKASLQLIINYLDTINSKIEKQ